MIQIQAGAGLTPLGNFCDIRWYYAKCPRVPDQHPVVQQLKGISYPKPLKSSYIYLFRVKASGY